MRCIEIMCEAEPYGIRELGFVEDIEAIDEKILFRHYKNVLLSSPVDIFICGDADIDFAVEFLKDAFSRIETSQTKNPENVIVKEAGEVKKSLKRKISHRESSAWDSGQKQEPRTRTIPPW